MISFDLAEMSLPAWRCPLIAFGRAAAPASRTYQATSGAECCELRITQTAE
jgi:hypothetical protein